MVLSQMAKPDPKVLFHEATEYLKQHPEEIFRALRGALGLRLGLPMDAIRYLVRELGGGSKAPKDVVIEAAPPGVRVGATVDAMGTPLRAVLTIFVEELRVSTEEIRIGLQLAQEDLAQLLGASRQRVNQELKGFEREGAVRVEPTRLVVLSRDKLLDIAEG